jgi:catalytic LigB subunit of aromatic ring-opening dioxygenase
VTHSPLLVGSEAKMAGIFERVLNSPRLPAAARDPANWPPQMQHEWVQHQASRAAPAHRDRAVEGFRAVRAALDAFNPDFILIWGDDQSENFREDGVAPFCVFALDTIDSHPFRRHGTANAWGEPADTVIRTIGHRAGGRRLAASLVEQGFDVSYAYTMRHEAGLPHAFINAMLLLDYDRHGLPWPVVPFHINCYGSSTISKRGAFAHIDGTGSDEPDPPGPPPARCFALGAATARALRDSEWRVAVIASSSWSHSFLTAKNHYLYPDLPSDRARFQELRDGQFDRWQSLATLQLEDAGQQELLKWVCLAGAMSELGCRPMWTDLAETYIYAAPKAFAIFEAA